LCAEDNWTVLKITGKAYASPEGNKHWTPLQRGGKVSSKVIIKTEVKSSVRLLSPSGLLQSIGENQTLGLEENSSADQSSQVSSVLDEFLASGTRIRINAVRNAGDTLQSDWIFFCQLNKLSENQLDAYLELAAEYAKIGRHGRSAYILWRITQLFPEGKNGFEALGKNISELETEKCRWSVTKVEGNKKTPLANGMSVQADDRLQLGCFTAQIETFVQIYMVTESSDGSAEICLIFPDSEPLAVNESNEFISRVKPHSEIYLPSSSDYFEMDNVKGYAHLIFISSCGPVMASELKEFREKIKSSLKATPGVLDRKILLGTLPYIIRNLKVISLKHE